MGNRQMKYKGIEIKEITEPQIFNPPKLMLVWDNDNESPRQLNVCAIVNRECNRVITERTDWKHCAKIPEESMLATNRELARWLAQGNGEMRRGNMSMVFTSLSYASALGNDPIDEFTLVRKWDDTEWHNPTREYLGLEDA